jgi:hypothetical protein
VRIYNPDPNPITNLTLTLTTEMTEEEPQLPFLTLTLTLNLTTEMEEEEPQAPLVDEDGFETVVRGSKKTGKKK